MASATATGDTPLPAQAWAQLCQVYTHVAREYERNEGGLPPNTALQPLLQLPVVRSLRINPLRRKGTTEFSLENTTSATVLNLKAALCQLTGTLAGIPCDRCFGGFGLWQGCVTAPAIEGHCANCT